MLTAADLALHAALAIDPDMLEAMQVRRVDDREARDVLALNGRPGRLEGVLYPYLLPGFDRPVTHRLRRDFPEVERGKPKDKYLSAFGDGRHLYFAAVDPAWLTDPSVSVIVSEAEKSALAIACAARRQARRLVSLALGGCWNWRGRIGKTTTAAGARVDETGPLPDFGRFTWAGRVVVLAFDVNAATNRSVQTARRALDVYLTRQGAIVQTLDVPALEGVNGPDDFLGQQGDQAWFALVDAATTDSFTRAPGKKGGPGAIVASSLANVRLALARLRVSLTCDAFTRDILVNGVPLDDAAVDRLWVRIDDTFEFRPSKEILRTVLVTEAERCPVHPVAAYLDALVWDGTPRLDTWLVTYAGADDTPYVRAVGALPLIAAVRRVRSPGAKFDELLVLEGDQGTERSTAMATLCPRAAWFGDDVPLGCDSKQVIERTCGRWLIEASELYGHRGREVEQLKAFLSRQVDGPVRLAYGRLPVSVPRQFILIGTTNNAIYLKDATGARRFWPVRVDRFDIDALARDRDQLWAEAAAREAAGESIRLDKALWTAAGHEQEQRRASDPWEEVLEPIFTAADAFGDLVKEVPVAAIWTALAFEANRLDNGHADRVNAIAQRYGFMAKRLARIPKGAPPRRYWLKPASLFWRGEDTTEEIP